MRGPAARMQARLGQLQPCGRVPKGAKVYKGSPAEAPPRPPGACSTTTGVLRPGLGPARAKDCCLSDVVPQPPVFGRRLLRCQPLATDLSLTQN